MQRTTYPSALSPIIYIFINCIQKLLQPNPKIPMSVYYHINISVYVYTHTRVSTSSSGEREACNCMKIEDIYLLSFPADICICDIKTTDCHCQRCCCPFLLSLSLFYLPHLVIVVCAVVDFCHCYFKRLPINRYCFKKSSRIFSSWHFVAHAQQICIYSEVPLMMTTN